MSEAEIAERVAALERPELREFASALAPEDDPGIVQLRSSVLFELGEDGQAARLLADQIAAGIDLGGLFWSWMQAEDPTLATRRYVAISRAVLERYEGLDEQGRRHADLFLCDETFGGSLESCTEEAIRLRLDRLENSY